VGVRQTDFGGDGEASFAPCTQASGKRAHALDSIALKRHGDASAGELAWSRAVQDNFAARRYLYVAVTLKLVGVNANGAGNRHRFAGSLAMPLEIDQEKVFAGLEFVSELIGSDSRKPELAQKGQPMSKLAPGEESGKPNAGDCNIGSRLRDEFPYPIHLTAKCVP
jgi:hypothetical protein